MKNQIINEIQRKMLPYLNNEQLLHLKMVLETSFQGLILEKGEELPRAEEQNAVKAFITAKRIEGCSEKTLTYYSKTIEAMLNGVGKLPQQITTDDLRKYLTNYQTQRRSSKVTIDNIRRILSSFFSWLEDEDFIVKSPVRRIDNLTLIESPYGKIPQGWHYSMLGDLCKSVSVTHNFNTERLIFLNTGDVEDGMFLHSDYMAVADMPGQAKKTIMQNDILYSEITLT